MNTPDNLLYLLSSRSSDAEFDETYRALVEQIDRCMNEIDILTTHILYARFPLKKMWRKKKLERELKQLSMYASLASFQRGHRRPWLDELN